MSSVLSKLVVIYACFVSLICCQNFYDKNPNVIELNNVNFDRVIHRSNYTSIVEFYAPWCGHCKELKPQYEKLGKKLKDSAPIQVTAINCDQASNKQICSENKIEGYPTIMVFRPPKVTPGKPSKKPKLNMSGFANKLSLSSRHASEVYKGERKFKPMLDFTMGRVKNYVKKYASLDKLYNNVVRAIEKRNKKTVERPQVVYITKSKNIPILLKTLAIDWLDVVDFQMVSWSRVNDKGICKDNITTEMDDFFCNGITELDHDKSYFIALDSDNKTISIHNDPAAENEENEKTNTKSLNNRLNVTNWLLDFYKELKPKEGLTSKRHQYLNSLFSNKKLKKKTKAKKNTKKTSSVVHDEL